MIKKVCRRRLPRPTGKPPYILSGISEFQKKLENKSDVNYLRVTPTTDLEREINEMAQKLEPTGNESLLNGS